MPRAGDYAIRGATAKFWRTTETADLGGAPLVQACASGRGGGRSARDLGPARERAGRGGSPSLPLALRAKLPPVSDDKPAAPAPKKTEDVLLVVGESEHGHAVLRKREQSIEVGELRPMAEGKPVYGEVVRLKPRADGAGCLFDVETIAARPVVAAGHGPAQVSNDTYRANWDAIFGARREPSQLN